MKTVLVVVGTRPEAIKLLPLHRAFGRNPAFRSLLVSTGQHREMLNALFQFFDARLDVDLDLMTANQGLSDLAARLLTGIDAVLVDKKPDAVVVQGDTTTCMAASLAAYHRRIKVVHVEAGLRTGDRYSPFPEEVNRRITDSLATLLFAPTPRAAEALAREGIREGVHVVGNTVIDALLTVHHRVSERTAEYAARFAHLVGAHQRLVLVTGHRRESFGSGFEEICAAITTLAARYPDAVFIYPVHLNPNVQGVVRSRLGAVPNVKLLEPVPYDELVWLLGRSWMVLTDSGGIQEEAPSLGKPVIVMRPTTERPEAVDAGCALLAGNTTKGIVEAFTRVADHADVYRAMSRGHNPYGDGRTSEAIVGICEAEL